MVWPTLSTARDRSYDGRRTRMYVSSRRQLIHTDHFRRWNTYSSYGVSFKTHQWMVEWPTDTPRSCGMCSR
jgi:hypothetical protein